MPNMKDIPTKQYFTGRMAGEERYNSDKGHPVSRVHARLDNQSAKHLPPTHETVTHPTRTITKIYSPINTVRPDRQCPHLLAQFMALKNPVSPVLR
jgi:hypothetical protein